jgi:predicted alpha/beta superfamily hydrolase
MRKYMILIIAVLISWGGIYQSEVQNKSKRNYLIEIGIPDSLYSNTLDEQRNIWIHLPENYKADGSIKYPVVYVLDGGVQLNSLATVYNNYWGNYLPDMILVGISNKTNRTRDLTTSKVATRYGAAYNNETGGAENFTEFIEKELIPYVDSKYATTAYRTLIGHSFGGLFTINALINHPHLFENYIAIDPSLDWDNQIILKQAKLKLQTENYEGKSLFVSLASEQLHMQNAEISLENVMQDTSEFTLFARSIIEFSNIAEKQKQNGLSFAWKSYLNDLHGTVPLPSMRDGLLFLFDWYQLESGQQFSNPETPLAELLVLVKKREEKLTRHFGYPTPPADEELFNMGGYMYMQFRKLKKSHAFFNMAIKYYPKSVNAHDSMADYYTAQSDVESAIKELAIAYEISGLDMYKQKIEILKSK